MSERDAPRRLCGKLRGAFARALQGLLLLAYPAIVYLAHARLSTRRLAALLLLLYAASLLLRLRGGGRHARALLRQHLGLAALIVLALASGERRLLLLLPTAVSLYLFVTFAASLRRGPSMIERFARLVEDDLPDFTLPYCRAITWVWCGFLAANALVAGALAVVAPLAWWTLYTGAIFYALMAALLAAEFVFRKLWFRYYEGGVFDRVFARLFPAEDTANGRRSLAYQAARRRVCAAATRASA
jgi:uncharacterized membrane protein